MTAPNNLCQDTQEKQHAELERLAWKPASPSMAWKQSIDAAVDSNLKQEQVRMEELLLKSQIQHIQEYA